MLFYCWLAGRLNVVGWLRARCLLALECCARGSNAADHSFTLPLAVGMLFGGRLSAVAVFLTAA
eukprot:11204129-Lingulodinium_polyedra.AAC.1